MKAVILAAGYGTRLLRDLELCKSEYLHLIGLPKPLLPVAGHPLISHWISMLQVCNQVTCIYVTVNAKYLDKFEEWSKDFPGVKLLCDGTMCNEERLGAVGAIHLAVSRFNIQDHLIVIGGDTLFFEDFSLSDMISKFMECLKVMESAAMVSCYSCSDEETIKHGIVEVDAEGCITSFLEKPLPSTTRSRLACPCFYILSKGSLRVLDEFLAERKDSPLVERDATGHFIRYLSERTAVFTKEIQGRFDVGGLQSYLECCQLYKPPPAR